MTNSIRTSSNFATKTSNQQQLLVGIQMATRNLRALVNELSDSALIKNGSFKAQQRPLHIPNMFDEVIKMSETIASTARISLRLEQPSN